MKTLIRWSLQLMIVCYIGCVVAVEPLYTVARRNNFEVSGESVLALLKYDFKKNTWDEVEVDQKSTFGALYVYNSRVYVVGFNMELEESEANLYIFDSDLRFIKQTPLSFKQSPLNGIYVDSSGIFIIGNKSIENLRMVVVKYDLLGNYLKEFSFGDKENDSFIPVRIQKDRDFLVLSGFSKVAAISDKLGYVVMNPSSLEIIRSQFSASNFEIDKDAEFGNFFIHQSFSYAQIDESTLSISRLKDMSMIREIGVFSGEDPGFVQAYGNKIIAYFGDIDGNNTYIILKEYSLTGDLQSSREIILDTFTPGFCLNIQKGIKYFPGTYDENGDVGLGIMQVSDNLQEPIIIGKKNTQGFGYIPLACTSEDSPNLQNLQRFSPFSFQRGSGFGF